LMAMAHQRRQLGVVVALQSGVRIALHQRRVAGVEVFARAQIADQVRGGGAKGIVARLEARRSGIGRYLQRGVFGLVCRR
jgi:hypothetical protein